jgi:hypothetical protein
MYTQADTLAYYFVKEGQAVLIPVQALRKWLGPNNERLSQYDKKVVRNPGYMSEGYPVSLEDLRSEVGYELVTGLPKWGDN